jgi:hypothetical protein
VIERHFHWEYVAFNGEPNCKEIPWPVTVEVAGYISEDDAKQHARIIVERENFVLRRVWECQSCGFNEQHTKSQQELVEALHGPKEKKAKKRA